MAVTVTIVKRGKLNNSNHVIADITMDSSYATGGEAVTPALFGLGKIHTVQVPAVVGSRLAEYDNANSKIKMYSAVGTEVVAATNLSAVSFRAVVIGE